MAVTTTTLYPPVMSSYMPAFVIDRSELTGSCKVYFSLSSYNNADDIKYVQVAVYNQYTNKTVLDEDKYPAEIMITSLKSSGETEGEYYITLDMDDIQDGFEYDEYYKVQLRFVDTNITSEPTTSTPQANSSWLTENLDHFSEWSKVCLIHPISQPSLALSYFTEGETTEWDYSSIVKLLGKITYNYYKETEYVKQYKVILYAEDGTELLDSGNQYAQETTMYNTIDYTFPYNFVQGDTYSFKIEYTTINDYVGTYTGSFIVTSSFVTTLDVNITAKAYDEEGAIKITVAAKTNPTEYSGKAIIKRSSSVDNYTTWENIKTLTIVSLTDYKKVLYDYSIESGVLYKYSIQAMDDNGFYGPEIKTGVISASILEYSFLTTKDRQLKLKFDTAVGSFKEVVQDSTTTTLGSQYPYIRRNSSVEYKQLSLSGLITIQGDDERLFYSESEIYDDAYEDYQDYNSSNKISASRDFTLERLYREKVLAFLNDGEAKLLRTPSEGNILLRISDVSLTSVATLGRLLYSFSCTANEIADNNLDNYATYGIIDPTATTRLDSLSYSSGSEITDSTGNTYIIGGE